MRVSAAWQARTSEQAQQKVIADRYPIHLIAGGAMVATLRRLGLARGAEVRADWLEQLRAAG